MAGADPTDVISMRQPQTDLEGLKSGIQGLKVGFYQPYFEDSDPQVVSACLEVLDMLKLSGGSFASIVYRDTYFTQ